MMPSQKAKSAGLDSLAEVSRMTGVSTPTLNNWNRDKSKLFDIVIEGCAARKGKDKVLNLIREACA